jgi:hypothetical protein
MPDVVVTVPKDLWGRWIDEGVLPGERCPAGTEFVFKVAGKPMVTPGERIYIVAHGKLRGYAPLVRVKTQRHPNGSSLVSFLVRRGGAIAVTIPMEIRGSQGYRYRFWQREDEVPFPDWRTP